MRIDRNLVTAREQMVRDYFKANPLKNCRQANEELVKVTGHMMGLKRIYELEAEVKGANGENVPSLVAALVTGQPLTVVAAPVATNADADLAAMEALYKEQIEQKESAFNAEAGKMNAHLARLEEELTLKEEQLTLFRGNYDALIKSNDAVCMERAGLRISLDSHKLEVNKLNATAAAYLKTIGEFQAMVEAAKKPTTPKAKSTKDRVLEALGTANATTDHLVAITAASKSTVQKALAELRKEGKAYLQVDGSHGLNAPEAPKEAAPVAVEGMTVTTGTVDQMLADCN